MKTLFLVVGLLDRKPIEFVDDRPGHDLRYSLDSSKIRNSLNWNNITNFEEGLQKTIEWVEIESKNNNIDPNILNSTPWKK